MFRRKTASNPITNFERNYGTIEELREKYNKYSKTSEETFKEFKNHYTSSDRLLFFIKFIKFEFQLYEQLSSEYEAAKKKIVDNFYKQLSNDYEAAKKGITDTGSNKLLNINKPIKMHQNELENQFKQTMKIAKADPKNYSFEIFIGLNDNTPIYKQINFEDLGVLLKSGKIRDEEVRYIKNNILNDAQIMALKNGNPISITSEQISEVVRGGKRIRHKKTRRHIKHKRSKTRKH